MLDQKLDKYDIFLDEWVMNRYLMSKKPLEPFEYIKNEFGILIIVERLPRNQFKCVHITDDGYSPLGIRRLKESAEGVEVITMLGEEFEFSKAKKYKATNMVIEQTANRIKAIETELTFLDDGVLGKRQQRLMNLQIDVLKTNLENLM